MYLFLQCEVTIGKVTMLNVHHIETKSSWKELTDTATITLPRNLKYKDDRIDQLIKRYDPVTIKVGYNGNMVTEFVGYVREVEPNVPVRVHCEDEMLMLKGGTVYNKIWKKAAIADIINTIAPAYPKKVISGKIDYRAQNKSAAQILLDLREYGIFTYFKTIDGVRTLYCGFAYDFTFDEHIYHMQKNVRSNDLKYRLKVDPTKDEPGVRAKAVAKLPDGKKQVEYYPSQDTKGEEVEIVLGELAGTEAERKKALQQYAKALFMQYNVDGYRGSIHGFAIPVIRHGDTITIQDAIYPEREGKYMCDATQTIFDVDAVKLERISTLGAKARI
jgi:hypothetical protein